MFARSSLTNLFVTLALSTTPFFTAPAALASDKLVVLTGWFAQAEHCGLYQAQATGIYQQEDLDVTIKMAGPQVNAMQLLLAGEADIFSGSDFQVLNATQHGLPVIAIAAQFQHDMQGIIAHPDVSKLEDLKTRTILMSTAARLSWWPWIKRKYALSDEQTKPYTFNSQPFLVDPNAVEQAYPSSEPFGLKQQNIPYHFFLFADDGYPPYGQILVTRQEVLRDRGDVLRRFVHATMAGWLSYLNDPVPGNSLIKADNPKMSDEQIAFAISEMKRLNVVGSGDAALKGVGTMTEGRWKADYDYMVQSGLLAETDWHKAFTTSVVDGLNLMPK